jgi:peroxiredoxin
MLRKIIASIFLLILLSITIYNTTNKQDDDGTGPNEFNVTGDATVDGVSITPPNTPQGIQVGQVAPNFTLQTLKGEKLQLSDLRGKKVFLNFWATWCNPCKKEMPEMQKFYEAFGDEVVIVAVNATASEKSIKDVQDYVDSGAYTFPVLLDRKLKVSDRYQIITIPTTYFIGTDGIVQLQKKVGPMTYEFMVEMKNKLK